MGHPELDHTSVLKIFFPHWKSEESGNYRNASLRSDSSDFQSYNFEVPPVRKRESQVENFLAKRGIGIVGFCGSFLKLSPCSAILPLPIGFNLQEDDAKFFELSKTADDGSPRAGRLSKTCPDVPDEFRVSSCKQESRLIIHLGIIGWLGTWDNPELLAVAGS